MCFIIIFNFIYFLMYIFWSCLSLLFTIKTRLCKTFLMVTEYVKKELVLKRQYCKTRPTIWIFFLNVNRCYWGEVFWSPYKPNEINTRVRTRVLLFFFLEDRTVCVFHYQHYTIHELKQWSFKYTTSGLIVTLT